MGSLLRVMRAYIRTVGGQCVDTVRIVSGLSEGQYSTVQHSCRN